MRVLILMTAQTLNPFVVMGKVLKKSPKIHAFNCCQPLLTWWLIVLSNYPKDYLTLQSKGLNLFFAGVGSSKWCQFWEVSILRASWMVQTASTFQQKWCVLPSSQWISMLGPFFFSSTFNTPRPLRVAKFKVKIPPLGFLAGGWTKPVEKY